MKKKTTEEFIQQSKEINNDRYDYSKTVYKNAKTKVIITCKKHGDFVQNPNLHISQKCGCPKCSQPNRNITFDELNKKIKSIFNEKIIIKSFINFEKPVIVECKKHGEFTTYVGHLLKGHACRKCRNTKTIEQFIKEAKLIHNNKYDYSLVNYVNSETKIKIICSKHGVFEQTPSGHLRNGCPKCKSSRGEEIIRGFLINNDILFKEQFVFSDLKYKGNLRFDFYIPDDNLLIEYQGIQHYKPVKIFGGKEMFEKNITRDELKRKYCKENNLILEEIKYDENILERLNIIFQICQP